MDLGISIDSDEPQPAAPAPSASRWGPAPRFEGKAHPGRSGPAWRACRKACIARDRNCGICGLPLNPNAKKWAADGSEADHYPVTLAMMEEQHMSAEQVRHLSTSPSNVRIVHRSCHRGGGVPYVLQQQSDPTPRTASRRW
jgi:5-methylcytosine-specific restriction endonuclease McrA